MRRNPSLGRGSGSPSALRWTPIADAFAKLQVFQELRTCLAG